MNTVFINEAYTNAIKDYLDSKHDPEGPKFSSFSVVVIRALSIIYDELDILTPYNLNNEEMFIINMQKYGYLISDIVNFDNQFLNYYNNPNGKDFIEIQKKLIDMYARKKRLLNISDEEINKFRKLLFSSKTTNPLMLALNYKMANNSDEVLYYYEDMLKNNKKEVVKKEKKTLSFDAYKILNYSEKNIDDMTCDELDVVNKKVYNYFSINENAVNKDYLLDKAIFDFNHPKKSFSTGNGYVDIIFILAIIATLIMLIFIITLFIA